MTPCINICSLDKGICRGCYRTLDEIIEWKDYTMSERMEIMGELSKRREELMKGSPCPSCGLDNNCAIDSGKSSTLCWCMIVEKDYKPNLDVDKCFCKRCFRMR